mgnify:CR=1 FL=1
MPYFQRIVETPYMRRVYTYENQVPSDFQSNRDDYMKSLEGSKTDKSLRHTRDKLALTIQSNIQPYSKFITLTTQENIQDRSLFLDKFKAFKRAYQRKYGHKIEYSAVMETQKRGAWHIHMVAYNLTHKLDLKEIDKLWQRVAGKGHVDFKVVDSHRNMFKYLIKYLTKEEVKINKKAVLSSQGLKRPTVITTWQKFDYRQISGEPQYMSTWGLYHGDQKDIKENKVKPERLNFCEMLEWHK